MRLKDASSSNETKRVPWRLRPDLQSASLEFEGRPRWGIKDPLNLAYFELADEAFFVLNQLDGIKTAENICRSFHERFRPRTLSVEELGGFVTQLVSQNLVVAEMSGCGRSLVAKQDSAQSRQRRMALFNVLAIRFRGFDPDQMLGVLLVWLRWVFNPMAVALGLLLIVSAATLVAVHFDELLARLPDAQALLSAQNLVGLSLLLAGIKVLHEFGHGLACKRFGGECHEMGLMLLIFTPTLYCNVSDIWMVKDKWKRIAVSVAGMWVEAVVAATCTILWWFSVPGLFHSLCLNVMFLCGVNTFIFNGNPLLRYDGYFVLSDWLEIPNLQQQSMATVRARLSQLFCGFNAERDADLSSRWTWSLLTYGIASAIYRVVLGFLILWALHRWLSPLGFAAIVQLVAVLTLVPMLLSPMVSIVAFFRSPTNREQISWPRFWSLALVTAFSLFALVCIPLPCRVTAGAIAEDDDAVRVYVTFAGTLIDSVQLGQTVAQGDVIAHLEDPRLKVVLAQLEGELNQQRTRLEQLERRRVSEPAVAQNIPTVRESVRDLEQQLIQRHQDAERLVVRSPRSGRVLSAVSQRASTRSDALPGWSGSPLEERNRGSYLLAGTTLCSIGEDDSRTALLLVSQEDVNLVRTEQRVRILWDEFSGQIQDGSVVEIAGFDRDTLSRDALIKLNLPVRVTSKSALRPVGKWYQVRVKLRESDIPLIHGAAGAGKILVDPQSLAHRALRWLKQTFPL